MQKLKTVFFGTPDFAVPSLEMLRNHPQVDLIGVVSMPDRPSGRGHKMRAPEIAELAKKHKLPLFQTPNINKEEKYLQELEELKPDLFVVLAFAQFLGSRLLKLPAKGCFNIHTSLLPKYRGAAPIQYALLNGDSSTGVSIQRMVKKMDAGDIAWSKEVSIHPQETGGQLYTRLKYRAALSLNDFVYAAAEEKLEYAEQDEDQVSFAPTLKKEDGFLDFASKDFGQIKNQIRALDPWPGTYCYLNKKRLKVFCVQKEEGRSLKPGAALARDNMFLVGCKDATLRIADLQLEGKKRCSDSALLNGLQNSKEENLTINPDLS